MRLRNFALCSLLTQSVVMRGAAQQIPSAKPENGKSEIAVPFKKKKEQSRAAGSNRLHRESTTVTAEITDSFALPPVCDADGNLYIRGTSDMEAIIKLNAKGTRVTRFLPSSPDVTVTHGMSYTIAPDGDLYELIIAHEITRYVFVYNKDGSVKSEIKLQKPGLALFPSKIAVFGNGDLLVTGMTHDKDRTVEVMWPFTGIFASDGTLLRELTLKDDESIHDMAMSGDPRVTAPGAPYRNSAIQGGQVETGVDGNVYVMRRLSPAIFYVISPGGSVRRFEVDPGQEGFMPESMHVSGSRIAVMFWQRETYEQIIKVVDLNGRTLESYYEPPAKENEDGLGLGFACYTQNPEHFTFVNTTEDNKLSWITATPN